MRRGFAWGKTMKNVCLSIAMVLALTCFCAAQESTCSVKSATEVSHVDGLTEWSLSFAVTEPGATEKNVHARAYVPELKEAVPGIVFTHSAIHSAGKTYNYSRFPKAFARAGAATIVLDRTIQWDPYDEGANRSGDATLCAMQWLESKANLDQDRLAVGGPAEFNVICDNFPAGHCYSYYAWLNFGLQSHAESENTERMLSSDGQMKAADWLTRVLKMNRVNPESLGNEVVNDGM
jgi:hypothetical protein